MLSARERQSFSISSIFLLNCNIRDTCVHNNFEMSVYFQSESVLLINSTLWFTNNFPNPLSVYNSISSEKVEFTFYSSSEVNAAPTSKIVNANARLNGIPFFSTASRLW